MNWYSDLTIQLVLWGGITFSLFVHFLIVLMNFFILKDLKIDSSDASEEKVSMMIPMRNEQKNVNEVMSSVLSSKYKPMEVLVADDHSEDETFPLLLSWTWTHPELTFLKVDVLPQGWTGKNYACASLSDKATGEILIFMDADVRISVDAISASVSFLKKHSLDFLSIFPEQKKPTMVERICLPVMDFFLYAFLPLLLMEKTGLPAFAAANGQWIVVRKEAYLKAGGHTAIRNNVLDDMALVRLIKRNGGRVALANAAGKITCRMYESSKDLLSGFGKNVFAAFGNNILIFVLFQIYFVMIFVFPFVAVFFDALYIIPLSLVFGIRVILALRLKSTLTETLLYHIPGIFGAIVIGWYSVWLTLSGNRTWKDRKI
jgi:glycosyltransferase involved in cell wall biosynthesis